MEIMEENLQIHEKKIDYYKLKGREVGKVERKELK